ncbi:MAG: ribosomal RNA small subunit methyltransferase A [Clostridiales bacterium]|nr:ribosomal RNA small subunit methyltransferase A [Clostridiales bacterium]
MSKYQEKNFKNNKKSSNFNENNAKNIDFKKNLGQNFLFDTNLLKAIVRDGLVEKDDLVLEIGAGAGTLTKEISLVAKKVISFEIDKDLIERLTKLQNEQSNIEFKFQDFMDADVETLFDGKARVVANIPYYITTPIIFKLINSIHKFKSIMVLIQKEVADRFASSCGTKEYGITSVILQSIFDVSIPRIVKKECFTPMPKIDSAICLLVPHNRYKISSFDDFRNFVHLAFSMRRKTLVNNLKSKFEKEIVLKELKELGYGDSVRPEEINVENFIKLFEKLKNN